MSTPGPGQPNSINSLLRRWLAVRSSKLAAARAADQVAPHFDREDFAEHLPLLGSAALLQLARDSTKPVVTFGSYAAGCDRQTHLMSFLPIIIHMGCQHVGARRKNCVLYMRRDVVAACDAFNARVQAPLIQQAAAASKIEQCDAFNERVQPPLIHPAPVACTVEVVEDSNNTESVARSRNDNNRAANDNKVSLPAALSRYDLNDMTIRWIW